MENRDEETHEEHGYGTTVIEPGLQRPLAN